MASSTTSTSSSSPLDVTTNPPLSDQQSSQPVKQEVQRRQRKTIANSNADLPPPETETETQDTNDVQEQDPPISNPEPQLPPSELQSIDGVQEQDENTAKTNESGRPEANYLPQLNETIARLMAIQMQPVVHESTLDLGRRRAELKRIMGVRKGKGKGKKGGRKGRGSVVRGKRNEKLKDALKETVKEEIEGGEIKKIKQVEAEEGDGDKKEKGDENDNMKEMVKEEIGGEESGETSEKEDEMVKEAKEKERMKGTTTTTVKEEIVKHDRKQVKGMEDQRVVRDDDGDIREESQVGEAGTEKHDQIGSENYKKLAKIDDGGELMKKRTLREEYAETKSTHDAEHTLSERRNPSEGTDRPGQNTKDSKQEIPEHSDILDTALTGLKNSNDKIDVATTQIETEIIRRRLIQEFIKFGQGIVYSEPPGKAKRTINDLNTRLPPQFIKAIRNKAYGDEFDEAYYRAVEVYTHAPDALASEITMMFGELSRLLGFGTGDARELGCEKEGGVDGYYEDGLVGVEVEVKEVEGAEEAVGRTQQDTKSGVTNAVTGLEKVLHRACGQTVIRGQSSVSSGQNAVDGSIASTEGKGMNRKGKAKGKDLDVDHGRNQKKDDSIKGHMVAHADLSISELLAILNESIDRLLNKAKTQEKSIRNMIRELKKSMAELDSLQEHSSQRAAR